MDLNDIALFVQVVRAGSFAEAGRRLNIPPSTGSRRIQQLEARLGVRLMQRSTRKLVLTNAGQMFFAQCAQQVDVLLESARKLSDLHDSISGRVRVAAPANFFFWFPVEAVHKFLSDHAGVHIEFELTDERVDLLAEKIDVAFRVGRISDPSLIVRKIGWTRSILVASPDYLAARGKPVRVSDLADHDCITPSVTNDSPYVWRLDGKEGVVETPARGRFSVNTGLAQRAAALAGLGIALPPQVMTASHIAREELRQVLPDYCVSGLEVSLIYPSQRHVPRAVSLFANMASTVLLESNAVMPFPSLGASS
ncbi:Transcriptional regulator [Paraburkholderia piptadeniae]|uniref:Transcriptional regulator n=1 Tax=Paraburkholderia piptadeniae TaxID=1701573 RepID=A0A1N7SFB0_9BURK|nr:LysR family transcriptional regulator [Paraburkholderia piptadeniae]SIT46030.1 Transcriptional regulator [Paraburkholderia piptadeniae]